MFNKRVRGIRISYSTVYHLLPLFPLYQSQYKKEGLQEEAQIHKIRITLTSRNVKSLEKGEWSSSWGQSCAWDSWAERNLHEKREVGRHAYTGICSTAT